MTKMQPIKTEIEVPEGVQVSMMGTELLVKGKEGELKRTFFHPKVAIAVKENKIIISSKNPTKREKRMAGTFVAHIKNMLWGVENKYTYRLKICSGHFPMNVAQAKDMITIKNFLGEKVPRTARIIDGCAVTINGDVIVVESINREQAGQTAANLESATRITNRDRRRFQDGIFITEKPKRSDL